MAPQKKGFFPNGPFQLREQRGMLPLSQPRPPPQPAQQPPDSPAASPVRSGYGVEVSATGIEHHLVGAASYPTHPNYTTPQGYGPAPYGEDYATPFNTFGTSTPHLGPTYGGQMFPRGQDPAMMPMLGLENVQLATSHQFSTFPASQEGTARVKPPRGTRGGAGRKKKHGNHHSYDTTFFQRSGQTASGASTTQHHAYSTPTAQVPGIQHPLSAAAPAFVPPQNPLLFVPMAVQIDIKPTMPHSESAIAFREAEMLWVNNVELERPPFPEVLSYEARTGERPTLPEGVKAENLNAWYGKSRIWLESRPMAPTPHAKITELELEQVDQMRKDGALSALNSYMHVVSYSNEDRRINDEVALREWESAVGRGGRSDGPTNPEAVGGGVRRYGAVGGEVKSYGAVGDGRKSSSKDSSGGEEEEAEGADNANGEDLEGNA